jgi:PGF-pre-PGF domain-containing protein
LNDVTTTGTCFTITATNVTLNLNGNNVFYGNQNSATAYYGVYSNKNYTTVKNGYISRGNSAALTNTRYGIYMTANSFGTVDTLYFSDNYRGINFFNVNYTNVTNVAVFDSTDYGIFFDNGAYNFVNNVISNYNSRGVYFYETVYSNVSNVIANYNSYSGLDFNHASNCRATNASLNYNGEEGFWVGGASSGQVLTNISAAYNKQGVFFTCTSCTLENSNLHYNTDYGIYAGDYNSNFTMRNNNASGNGNLDFYLGIVFISDASNTVIDSSNIINFSKRVYYNSSVSNYVFDATTAPNVGAIYCIKCNNVTYKDFSIYGYTLYLLYSNNSKVENASIYNSLYGILTKQGQNNTFKNITVDSNDYGLFLQDDFKDSLINSTIRLNRDYSIYLSNADNFTLINSSVSSTTGYGIYNSNSDNVLVYNNFFNNSINYLPSSGVPIIFNTTLTFARNIMNRLYIGGNFWGYPNGTGFSETCADADKNGICDSSYEVDSGNYDYLPLYIADTSGPTMTFPFYTNATLLNVSKILTLNVTVGDVLSNVSSCLVNVNGTNQTIPYSDGWCNSSSIVLAGATGGNTIIKFYANDSINNFGLNNSYNVVIDVNGPVININSPDNRTYATDAITFNIDPVDDSGIVSSCNYSLDGKANISLTYFGGYWMKTNSSMTETNHNVTFYCIDSFGKFGSSTEYFVIDVPVSSSSAGGASSVQTTPLPEKSITVYLDKVIASKEVTSIVSLEGIYLTRITTLSKENISSATISIKTINNIVDSGLLFGLDEENIYQGLEINSSLKNENLENITFEFKIEKDWLAGKDMSQVTLQRKSESSTEWEMLNTTLVSDDDSYYYFKSVSPGFSLFAIYLDENLCTPGELFCSGEVLKLCHEDRSSTVIENCEFGCSDGKCLEYWEPDEKESIWQRFTKLLSGAWINFGNVVFIILVLIVSLAVILVSFITYKYFKKKGLIKK